MNRRHQERRAHKRIDAPCPLTVLGDDGQVLFKIRTANISNGGLYLETPASNLPESGVPDTVDLRISVPRTTANTFMLEEFQTHAAVIRCEPLADGDYAGMAIRFHEPLEMALEG